MKFLLTALLSITLASKVFSFTVHTSYDATSDYALGDIVPSSDANVLFYQAIAALTKDTHQLSDTSQWKAWASSDIPNSGNAPTEAVPESSPTESAPNDPPPDSNSTTGSGTGTDSGTDTVDSGIDSSAIQIFSLSTRAGIYGDDISASLKMGGDVTIPKKVMFRVKGPSMNFAGTKLADPWIDVYKKSNAQGSTFAEFFKSYEFGDHPSSSEYESRHTGNVVEPLVVDSITPSTVSCLVNSETTGASGNAIVEIYSLKDDNSSSFFKNLSTRGYISESDMTGSLKLVGTGTKHIMFRVKGPSMNFSGTKLADPNLAIYHKENDWGEIVSSSTFQEYVSQDTNYKNVTDSYVSRHTGNPLEPLVVYELSAGTYSCIVSTDISGAMGNAILEIYDVSQ